MKINNLVVFSDCYHYLGFKPCKFHKIDGRSCEKCPEYKKIKKRILIIKLDSLGDVLRTTSILPALIEKYPNSTITWITRKNAYPLLNGNPYISRKLAIEENYLQLILNEKFDIGICLDADPISATILSLSNCIEKYGFISNIKGQILPANPEAEEWYLMGIRDNKKRNNKKTYQEHIYEICKLNTNTQKPQVILDENSKQFAKKFIKINAINKYRKLIGINTGGGNRWQMKKWIFDYYIQLIKLLKSERPDIGIILLGGPGEIEFNTKIKEKVKNLIIDAGCDNSIRHFAALIELNDIFFTPDSFGMHISTALNRTTIVIVGPTSPWELDVYGNGEIIYNHRLDCIACYKSTCDKKQNCMNTLLPEKIFLIIEKYL
ncbi:MAG: glycosyltransferase family 9 protein [Candidatus Hodarchaeota archaeon]